jgi:hypothetical protein
MIQRLLLSAALLLACETNLLGAAPPGQVGLARLIALPSLEEYRMQPYLQAAEALQAAGKAKAVKLLRELAAKEKPLDTRTVTLCRMLFKARAGSVFLPPDLGRFLYVVETDWPSEPIEIVDGVPFLIPSYLHIAVGSYAPPSAYVRYCEKECDWNTQRFKLRSKKEIRNALEKFLALPKLKGKVVDAFRSSLEKQIK